MKSIRIASFVAALILLPGCRSGKPVAEGPFSYQGYPIHPAAIKAIYLAPGQALDLARFRSTFQYWAWEERPGWYIVDFEEDLATGRVPFFAYGLYASLNDLYLLAVSFNDGGEGLFDNLILVRRAGDELAVLKAWEEGDRCNGGIIDQRADGDYFYYTRDLTPAALLELATEVRFDLTPPDDLEETPDSCFAAATFRYSLAEDKEELLSVRLYDEEQEETGAHLRGYRYQACFNKVFNTYLRGGTLVLTPAAVNEFARAFEEQCLKK
ncbi:MAG: hypothetical protein OEW05_01275 [Candidatus Aminicenantes bacterium]|nr:hypothetical protein [Candidatus Aminicenantes bacterium]